MRAFAVTPAVEGAPASCRNPFASMCAGAGQLTAGANGVILGRFGFADPITGRVDNARTSALQQLGFVLPQWGTWQKLYCEANTWILREGLMVTLASRGDFWCRFAGGANAGQQVFANVSDGSAAAGILGPEWTADAAVVTADSIFYTADGGGYAPTQWTVVTPVCPGGLGVISSWQPPYFQ